MVNSGATAATMSTSSHPHFDHDDALGLAEYGLAPASSNALGASPNSIMGGFPDFDLAFAHTQNPGYPGGQVHRGSVGGVSDDNMSGGGSVHPRPLSIGGSPGMLAHEGHHTSPESAPAMGMLSMNDQLKSTKGMKLEAKDGPTFGSSTTGKRAKDIEQDTPQWTEMKTKAGKERKRLPLACIACRRKKIRCSGEKPACKHCVRSRIPCVYKVTTRKAAPRTDYMAMLDKRLKRMEDRVIKLIPKESLPSVANVGRSVVRPAIPGAPPKTPATKKRQAEEAFKDELDEWAKTKVGETDATGVTGRSKESDETRLAAEGAESLPPKEIQEHLAEVYFDYVYGQSYPLLHKPSFMRRLSQGKVPPVLVLAMCAISARFSTHPQLRTEPCFLRGDEWAQRARDIALKRYDSPNITILIVYLLLGLHEFGTCQGGRSWMFGGMAQRMAYALQLHKENEYDPSVNDPEKKPLSATDREIRRRTMWSCFLMDRFNSSGTDRPLFVHEQYIEVQLPIKEHLYVHEIYAPTENLEGAVPNPVPPDSGQLSNPRENMGTMAYTVRLVCVWGKLIKYMNLGGKEREPEPMWSSESTFQKIKKEAMDFRDSLPDMLVYTPENLKSHSIGKTANSFLYLHILWQQIMLFMHRFALPSTAGARPPKDMPHEFLTNSARTAHESANQISILINEAMDHNVVAPFAGYTAFFSSTVHVHGVFSKNPKLEAQSKKYLAYNVKYLTKMKKYWGMFQYVAENLKELYRQHADAQLKGTAANADGKSKANIFQYGDWFDRYPHGVSKTDYEDAAVAKVNEPGTDAVLGEKSDLQSVEEFFASLSPPSKADQRKQARKMKSKSISKATANATETSKPQRQNSAKLQQQNAPARVQQQQQSQQQQKQQQQQPLSHISIANDTAMSTPPTTTFDAAAYFPQQNRSTSQQFINDFAASHTMLDTTSSPSLGHLAPLQKQPTHPQNQMEMSNFPDLSADFNATFWNLEAMGMGGNNNFFDPMSAYFVPFNVDPPNMMGGGRDGAFESQSGADYGFGLGQGPNVDLNMLDAGVEGIGQGQSRRTGEGMGLDGFEGSG
jgi:hypothetical protein